MKCPHTHYVSVKHILTLTLQIEQPSETPPPGYEPFIAWEETTDFWINTADVMSFVPALPNAPLRFIISSERSGFRHLYLVNATPPQATPTTKTQVSCQYSLYTT